MNNYILSYERFNLYALAFQTFVDKKEALDIGGWINKAYERQKKGSQFIQNADATMKYNASKTVFSPFMNETYGAIGKYGKYISNIILNPIRLDNNIYLVQLFFIVTEETRNELNLNAIENLYRPMTKKDYAVLELKNKTLLNGLNKKISIPFNRNLILEKKIENECHKFIKNKATPLYLAFSKYKPIKFYQFKKVWKNNPFWKEFFLNSDEYIKFETENSPFSFYENIHTRESITILTSAIPKNNEVTWFFTPLARLLFTMHLRVVAKDYYQMLDITNAYKMKKEKVKLSESSILNLNMLRTMKHTLNQVLKIKNAKPDFFKNYAEIKTGYNDEKSISIIDYLDIFISEYIKEGNFAFKTVLDIIQHEDAKNLNKKIVILTWLTIGIGLFGLVLGTPMWSTIQWIICFFKK